MIHEENGVKILIQLIDHITEIYSITDESGIPAMAFINHGRGKKNWIGESQEYLDRHSNSGVTRIWTALKQRILDEFVVRNPNQSKPLLVFIITHSAVCLFPSMNKTVTVGARRTCTRCCVRLSAGWWFPVFAFPRCFTLSFSFSSSLNNTINRIQRHNSPQKLCNNHQKIGRGWEKKWR